MQAFCSNDYYFFVWIRLTFYALLIQTLVKIKYFQSPRKIVYGSDFFYRNLNKLGIKYQTFPMLKKKHLNKLHADETILIFGQCSRSGN